MSGPLSGCTSIFWDGSGGSSGSTTCGPVQDPVTGDQWNEVSGCTVVMNVAGDCQLAEGARPGYAPLSGPVACANLPAHYTCGPCGTPYHACTSGPCNKSTGGCFS